MSNAILFGKDSCMAISDKTRKLLWGKSGNRCTICRRELVIQTTNMDDESIVGDECHIISGQYSGPRHDPAFPSHLINEAENLLLLCKVHHKQIDDQHETYTVELLRLQKANHEKWVSKKLSDEEPHPAPIRVRRIRENIPAMLVRITG
jgi:HNH endonuclease